MSEKEFLKGFLEYAEVCDYKLDDNLIQTWLDYHHAEYYEVEFVKKEDDIEMWSKLDPKVARLLGQDNSYEPKN